MADTVSKIIAAFHAVKRDDEKRLQDLLNAGSDVISVNAEGRTLTM